jgi:hypothetical protein
MSAQIGTTQQRRKQYTSVINKSSNMSTSITAAKTTTYSTASRASAKAISSSNLSTPLNNNYHRIAELNGGSELACRSLEFWEIWFVVPYLDQVNVVKRFKADTKGNFYTNNLLLNVDGSSSI